MADRGESSATLQVKGSTLRNSRGVLLPQKLGFVGREPVQSIKERNHLYGDLGFGLARDTQKPKKKTKKKKTQKRTTTKKKKNKNRTKKKEEETEEKARHQNPPPPRKDPPAHKTKKKGRKKEPKPHQQKTQNQPTQPKKHRESAQNNPPPKTTTKPLKEKKGHVMTDRVENGRKEGKGPLIERSRVFQSKNFWRNTRGVESREQGGHQSNSEGRAVSQRGPEKRGRGNRSFTKEAMGQPGAATGSPKTTPKKNHKQDLVLKTERWSRILRREATEVSSKKKQGGSELQRSTRCLRKSAAKK